MANSELLQIASELRNLAERVEAEVEAEIEAGVIPIYGQRDERWASERLGNGETTIGRYGCVITCLAMAASAETGVEITPLDMNARLAAVDGGFVGPNKNLVVWGKIPAAVPELEFVELIDCQEQPAPVDEINAMLAEGGYVLAQVDFQPGGEMDQHWALVTGLADDGYWIYDPWAGRRLQLPPAYCRVGWDAARAIFRVVMYRGATTRVVHI